LGRIKACANWFASLNQNLFIWFIDYSLTSVFHKYNLLYKSYLLNLKSGHKETGEKGKIMTPKRARDIFGFKSGDTLIMLVNEKKGIAIPPEESFVELAAKIFADKEEN